MASAVLLFSFMAKPTDAAIDGVITTNGNFVLTAKPGYINTPDGNSIFMWGYALGSGDMQYPGPTLIVNQGDVITITLNNQLSVAVSIVFPGQTSAVALSSSPGLLTKEAVPGGSAQYRLTASQPGTYTYYSGTMPEIQAEMGLVGTIIVRPTTNPATWAYNSISTQYDREFLYFLTEIDPVVHDQVLKGQMKQIDATTFHPVYWFVNGRALPDTMLPPLYSALPNQPYNASPEMRVGERVLVRMVGAGRDLHPLHMHGAHHQVVARDGRLLSSGGADADLAELAFSTTVAPGQTTDAIYRWTGENLGWDFYGHTIDQPLVSGFGTGDEIFVQTTLNGGISDLATALTITAPGAGSFPATSAFRAVLWTGTFPGATVGDREVVRLKRNTPASNTFTMVRRGLEGTNAKGWVDGANIVYTDHGAPLPVVLPDQLQLTNGMFWSGSPYLGSTAPLPPGEGGFNPFNGFFFMWHSHNEKELTSNNIFPGGMATMAVVEHPDPAISPFIDVPNITTVTP